MISLENLDEFNDKLESCIRRDSTWSAMLAVRKVVRNVELILRSFRHELDTFCPSGDHLIEAEYCRFPTVV
jgi:hypothetical protein